MLYEHYESQNLFIYDPINGLVVKNPSANAGDTGNAGSICGSGRSPEEGNGNPVQYSCLGTPMDRRTWKATVHEVAKEIDAT